MKNKKYITFKYGFIHSSRSYRREKTKNVKIQNESYDRSAKRVNQLIRKKEAIVFKDLDPKYIQTYYYKIERQNGDSLILEVKD